MCRRVAAVTDQDFRGGYCFGYGDKTQRHPTLALLFAIRGVGNVNRISSSARASSWIRLFFMFSGSG